MPIRISLFILGLCLPLVAQDRKHPFTGPCVGAAFVRDNKIEIFLDNARYSDLTDKVDLKPPFYGNRLFVYFDVDEDKGAEYCIRVYRSKWFLYKESKPGNHDQYLAHGDILVEPTSFASPNFAFDSSLIPEQIRRAWTFYLYQEKP